LIADNSKARALLDWTPGIDLDEGLGRTISWTERNLGLFKTALYTV
jgi:nucleoside-diphosphate-sugar epimerase